MEQQKKIRILIAEDSPIGMKLAMKMIEHCGYEADSAENGRQAVDKACATSYDLILMDMFMPELNGGDASLEISSRGVTTPIIALSGDVIGSEELEKYRMKDSILKPLSESELTRVIAGHCVRKSLPAVEISAGTICPSSSHETVFDEKSALEFAGGDRKMLEEMLAAYVESTERNIALLSEGINLGDMRKAKSASHLIKGESKSLGAMKIFSSASEINDAAKSGDLGRCASVMQTLRDHFTEFCAQRGREGGK